MSDVESRCPHCSKAFKFDSELLGRRGRCKRCGQIFSLSLSGEEGASREVPDAKPARRSGAANGDGPVPGLLTPPSKAHVELPEQFGRYRILKSLGRGGMGAVYLAHDTHLDRRVALKVPHFTAEDGPEGLDRFYREAKAAAKLDHHNLCPVYDVGQVNGVHYLTMPYLEGKPLSGILKPGQQVSPRKAAELIRVLALALAEAHAKGVIHRDLKPANIMDTKRRLVIMDFGLARRGDGADAQLTKFGEVLGTPAYMAPEQVAGDVPAMGPGCDIYSLGVILYEFLTGRRPFVGPDTLVLGLIMVHAPEPPSKYRPGLDPQLDAICLRALAKKPEDRFATMAEFAAKLGDYLLTSSSGQVAVSGTGVGAGLGSGTVSRVDSSGGRGEVESNGRAPREAGSSEEFFRRLADEEGSVQVPLRRRSVAKPEGFWPRLRPWVDPGTSNVAYAAAIVLSASIQYGVLYLIWGSFR